MEDFLIESLIKIGNHKRIIEICEPNIMQPLQLEEWMIRRTLMAWWLLEDELQKQEDGNNASRSIA